MKLILMMAMTLDGIIAKDKTQNVDWTSLADKKAFVAETKKHKAIIFGETTFFVMGGKPLPERFNLVLSLTPEKFKDQEVPGTLEYFKGPPADVLKHLENKGYETAILGGGAGTNAAFLKANLVDEILITIEPKVFGRGLNFTEGEDLDLELELLESKEIGDNAVQLRYRVKSKV
ncbi:dihydrofolate reductase family protein [Patescibacteria group bacterium]|nr:dihydrofolate reductase family protein [Patescibacteria group bacterium]MBU4512860.1 dihydrofolate reductase family protein [Patescibacteria group bacterium]MCG2693635.1 dihydrofolate reductase family protein [Candidatus Parcubacteria bacterium]